MSMQKEAENVKKEYAIGTHGADYYLISCLEMHLSDDDQELGAFTREVLNARRAGQATRRAQILGVYDD